MIWISQDHGRFVKSRPFSTHNGIKVLLILHRYIMIWFDLIWFDLIWFERKWYDMILCDFMWFYVILWLYLYVYLYLSMWQVPGSHSNVTLSVRLFAFARSCPFLFSSLKEQHCRLILGVFRHTWKSLRCVVLRNSLFDFLLHFSLSNRIPGRSGAEVDTVWWAGGGDSEDLKSVLMTNDTL